MLRKVVCFLFALGLTVAVGLPAIAVSGGGSICITPHRDGNPVDGGEVTLYHVGTPVEGGFRLTDGLANWEVSDEEACTPEFAGWIIKRLRMEGTTKQVDSTGSVLFEDLEPGLYLVTQKRAARYHLPFNAFLMALEAGESRNAFPKVEAEPDEIPQTGDHSAPILWAMLAVAAIGGAFALSDKMNKRK